MFIVEIFLNQGRKIYYKDIFVELALLNGIKKKFNIQKEHDKRKRIYAQNNGYRLLEIKCCDSSYFENINKILQTNL